MRTLLLLVVGLAGAHPGADEHLHATADAPCTDDDAQLRRIQALTEEGRYEDAVIELERARDCGASSHVLDLAGGVLAIRRGLYEEAVDMLNRVLTDEPGQVVARLARAEAFAALDRPKQAADDTLAVARAHPSATQAWLDSATYRRRAGDPAAAAAHLDEGLTAAWSAPLALATSEAHAANGDDQAALAALDGLPDTADVLARRSALLQALGRVAEARATHAEAIARASEMRESPKKREILAQLEEKDP